MSEKNSKHLVEATRDNTILLMAASSGYDFDGFRSEGYKVYSIYKNVRTIKRILREICFRLPLFPKEIWFDTRFLNLDSDTVKFIILNDTLVSVYYLKWLRKHYPKAQINYMYNNMVGNANHLLPHQIPDDVRVWTYDEYDSKKYHLRLKKTNPYFSYFVKESHEKKYDLFFVGRDKGRGEWLCRFEKWLNNQGIRTNFIIVKDGKFKKRKTYYKNEISYDETVYLVSQSRAVLNVTMKNQRGSTLRDMECLFNKVKLVTTNKYIKKMDFYNKNNVFILGEDDKKRLKMFISNPYDDSQPINMELHSADAMVREVTSA